MSSQPNSNYPITGSQNNVKFFWEKNSQVTIKSRFNLLLLEFGEYFFEDLSVFNFPYPNDIDGRPFRQCESMKEQGRLKICSRSILFEPNDVRKPIYKFPFKYFLCEVQLYHLSPSERKVCSVDYSGFITFECSLALEMKANNKIGPYLQTDFTSRPEGPQLLFAFVHTDPNIIVSKIANLRKIFSVAQKEGWTVAEQQLLPLLSGHSATFDSSQLVDYHETPQFPSPVPVKRVRPLELSPGGLMLTDRRLYFQPAQHSGLGEGTQLQVMELQKVSQVYRRRYLLRQVGLEFILEDGDSLMLCFLNEAIRDQVYMAVVSQREACHCPPTPPFQSMLQQWQTKRISNFEYIMYLNSEAGRSLSDLAQYPVFPHILTDFQSTHLDLTNPSVFRDLSKPIGALNPARLMHYRERYRNMVSTTGSTRGSSPPPFLYGTHYSTPGYVLYFLVRVAPEQMLCLQGGKFDASDRMFSSIASCWDSCYCNPADLKELIPEFYQGDGSFLCNGLSLDFGRLQQGAGIRLDDVVLPPWATSPRDFIAKHRQALESDYVSSHLHQWIDLIFGYKQQGDAALQADNLFYHLTYEAAALELQRETDPGRRAALESQIQEFGQTPGQLFDRPHPRRSDDTEQSIQIMNSPTIAKTTASPTGATATAAVSSSSSTNRTPLSSEAKNPSVANNDALLTINQNSNNAKSTAPTGSPSPPDKSFSFLKSAVNIRILTQTVAERTVSLLDRSAWFRGTSGDSKLPPPPPPPPADTTTPSPSPAVKTNDVTTIDNNKDTVTTAATCPTLDTNQFTSPTSNGDKDLLPDIRNQLSVNREGDSDGDSDGAITAGKKTSIDNDSSNNNSPSSPSVILSRCLLKLNIGSKITSMSASATTATTAAAAAAAAREEGSMCSGTAVLAVCCTSDGSIAVWSVEYSICKDSAGVDSSEGGSGSGSKATSKLLQRFSSGGMTSSSVSSFAKCVVASDGTMVIGASDQDDCIYRASLLARRLVHEDRISALALEPSGNALLTSSSDSSVRLWEVLPGGNFGESPAVELFDLQYPVTAVALLTENDIAGISYRNSGTISIGNKVVCIVCGEGDNTLSLWKLNVERGGAVQRAGNRNRNSQYSKLGSVEVIPAVAEGRGRGSRRERGVESSLCSIRWLCLSAVTPPSCHLRPAPNILCAHTSGSLTLLEAELSRDWQRQPQSPLQLSASLVGNSSTNSKSNGSFIHTLASFALDSPLLCVTHSIVDAYGGSVLIFVGCGDGSIRTLLAHHQHQTDSDIDTNHHTPQMGWKINEVSKRIDAHEGPVVSLALLSDYCLVSAGQDDGLLKIWQLSLDCISF